MLKTSVWIKNHIFSLGNDFNALDSGKKQFILAMLLSICLGYYLFKFHKKIAGLLATGVLSWMTSKIFGDLDDISPLTRELLSSFGGRVGDYAENAMTTSYSTVLSESIFS